MLEFGFCGSPRPLGPSATNMDQLLISYCAYRFAYSTLRQCLTDRMMWYYRAHVPLQLHTICIITVNINVPFVCGKNQSSLPLSTSSARRPRSRSFTFIAVISIGINRRKPFIRCYRYLCRFHPPSQSPRHRRGLDDGHRLRRCPS
jgi:hypothetical protein